ncbi:hypothetical protein DCAR_0418296 [Daucus carota subsp. sativus]|uniref:Phytosulfokine n=1 Tax=Daucus carota subsp. sativus TaxID=79200 RepID=A0AAF0X3B4_DAUCS|nr:hypothetical protein DCAR_0418296 [Daucus carota subsp. sativus]
MPTKLSTLFMISLILLFTLTCAARHQPSGVKPQEGMGEEEPKTGEAKCGDGIAEEECMIRKTQEAHLDYIYTQDQKPRP